MHRPGARTPSPRAACCSWLGPAAGGTTALPAHGQPALGRLWERIPPDELALTFSRHVLELPDVADRRARPRKAGTGTPPPEELTAGRRAVLLFWRTTPCRPTRTAPRSLPRELHFVHVTAWSAWRFPSDIAGEHDRSGLFARWSRRRGRRSSKCLQPQLAERWLRSERAKGQIGDWADAAPGPGRVAALAAFLAACRTGPPAGPGAVPAADDVRIAVAPT